MTNYFVTPEWNSGKGFRCYVCGKRLAVKIRGDYQVAFRCPRCKTYIFIKSTRTIPWAQEEKKEEEKTNKVEQKIEQKAVSV